MEKSANGVPTVGTGTEFLENPQNQATLVQTRSPMKDESSSDQTGGASDRFYFNPKKEEEMERPPCKVFFEKEGQVYEEIQTVTYNYIQTVNTVHVERTVTTSEARPTSRVDVLKWFCK